MAVEDLQCSTRASPHPIRSESVDLPLSSQLFAALREFIRILDVSSVPQLATDSIPSAPSAAQDGPLDKERRTAKHVLFMLTVTPVLLLIITLLLFFQPDDQVLVTRHENGYLATRSRSVMGADGQPLLHGEHEAWYISGDRAEHGNYERGQRQGEWRYWNEQGQLSDELTGIYREGQRISALEANR
ncbi:MAG: hypothetical protein ACI835_003516 [Planctomycetota bacterium]|jgi:hypothetical protein